MSKQVPQVTLAVLFLALPVLAGCNKQSDGASGSSAKGSAGQSQQAQSQELITIWHVDHNTASAMIWRKSKPLPPGWFVPGEGALQISASCGRALTECSASISGGQEGEKATMGYSN